MWLTTSWCESDKQLLNIRYFSISYNTTTHQGASHNFLSHRLLWRVKIEDFSFRSDRNSLMFSDSNSVTSFSHGVWVQWAMCESFLYDFDKNIYLLTVSDSPIQKQVLVFPSGLASKFFVTHISSFPWNFCWMWDTGRKLAPALISLSEVLLREQNVSTRVLQLCFEWIIHAERKKKKVCHCFQGGLFSYLLLVTEALSK